jgi:hypothetical protein
MAPPYPARQRHHVAEQCPLNLQRSFLNSDAPSGMPLRDGGGDFASDLNSADPADSGTSQLGGLGALRPQLRAGNCLPSATAFPVYDKQGFRFQPEQQ